MVELSGSREKVEETVLQPGIFLLHLFIKYGLSSYHRKEDCHNVYRNSTQRTTVLVYRCVKNFEQVVLINHFQKNVGSNDFSSSFNVNSESESNKIFI